MKTSRIGGQPRESSAEEFAPSAPYPAIDVQIARYLLWFARLIAMASMLIGIAVLVGYGAGYSLLIVVIPGLQAMSVVTASGLILISGAILSDSFGFGRMAAGIASLALTLGVLEINSHVINGADTISPLLLRHLFPRAPVVGATSTATALSLFLISLAVSLRFPAWWRASNFFAGLSLLITGTALLGYAYGVRDLYALSLFRTMALHTALCLFFLSLAIMIDIRHGLTGILASPLAGGSSSRKLLLFIFLPIIAGWFLIQASDAKYIGPPAAMALLVVATIVPLSLLILREGNVENLLDLERQARGGIELKQKSDLEIRLEAQAAAAAARTRLETTLATTRIVGIWDWDFKADVVRADERVAEMFGMEPARAALGIPFGEYVGAIDQEDRGRVVGEIEQALYNSAPFTLEFRLRRPNGSARHVLARSKNILNESGRAESSQGVVVDISEQRLAENALKESEANYRSLFTSIEAGFCIVEMAFDEGGKAVDYRFIETNSAFEQQTGLRDVAGKWVRSLVPLQEQHWFDIYGRVALTGEPARFESPAKEFDGRWYDVHAFRTGDPASHRVAILFNDISEHRRAKRAV